MSDFDKLLERVPEERRDAIKKRWESMSAQERQQMLRNFGQRRGGQRGGQRNRPPQQQTD